MIFHKNKNKKKNLTGNYKIFMLYIVLVAVLRGGGGKKNKLVKTNV